MIEIDELKTLIPHRGKMILLSRILDYNLSIGSNTLQAEADITDNCIFYDRDAGGVPSWVGFEYIAQSISALSGIRDRSSGMKPKLGVLLSVSSLSVEIPVYKSPGTVKILIKEIDNTDTMHTFGGEVYIEDKLAMKGNVMTILIDKKDERFKEFAEKFNIEE